GGGVGEIGVKWGVMVSGVGRERGDVEWGLVGGVGVGELRGEERGEGVKKGGEGGKGGGEEEYVEEVEELEGR
uniref:hypothetical protein n=1 Tax=Corynebacterium glyciniphilum TaxID=1404244 RepID=UPI001C92BCB3